MNVSDADADADGENDTNVDYYDKFNLDSTGATNFLPRHTNCFQEELGGQALSGSKFCIGSLTAHEVCAKNMHKIRADNLNNFCNTCMSFYNLLELFFSI